MANSDFLRQNKNQHTIKNQFSNIDDEDIVIAMKMTQAYLEERFSQDLEDGEFYLELSSKIYYSEMIEIINQSKIRTDFDETFAERSIIPDGGILFLRKKQEDDPDSDLGKINGK